MKLSTLSAATSLPIPANRKMVYRPDFRSHHSRANDEIRLQPIAVIKAPCGNEYFGAGTLPEKGSLIDLYV